VAAEVLAADTPLAVVDENQCAIGSISRERLIAALYPEKNA
jgi:hypothetical protein